MFVALLKAFLVLALTGGPAGPRIVPEYLVDVDGGPVDVASLARTQKLFFVTLKTTSCPVCRAQLGRLMQQLPRLRSCDATFIVLAPGPASEILEVRDQTRFPFPFVEDEGLEVATSLGLRMSSTEISPAIFAVDESRAIVWMQRGRSGLYFGDSELLEYLDCATLEVAGDDQLKSLPEVAPSVFSVAAVSAGPK